MSTKPALPPAEAHSLQALITPAGQGIASRVLARTTGGNLTLFAFDAGQELREHTAAFDALVLVLDGALDLTIGTATVRATPGTVVLMPANVPHALAATEPARMLLLMLRDPQEMTARHDAADIRPEDHGRSESSVDEALAESFPASDPPSWNSGVATTRPSTLAERGRGSLQGARACQR